MVNVWQMEKYKLSQEKENSLPMLPTLPQSGDTPGALSPLLAVFTTLRKS